MNWLFDRFLSELFDVVFGVLISWPGRLLLRGINAVRGVDERPGNIASFLTGLAILALVAGVICLVAVGASGS